MSEQKFKEELHVSQDDPRDFTLQKINDLRTGYTVGNRVPSPMIELNGSREGGEGGSVNSLLVVGEIVAVLILRYRVTA